MDEKKAVALRYERYKDSAPKVVAKDKGVIAEKII
jgi:flagellar biosynthesis protein